MKIACPIPGFDEKTSDGDPVYYIVVPDEWFGSHAQRRDEAIGKLPKHFRATWREFAVALSLLDGWNLPGIEERDPTKWDFSRIRLEVLSWVSGIVLTSYAEASVVPKAS